MQELSFSNGDLHFSAVSLGEGPLVICLHGFPDCLHSFRHQMPALAAAGYRVVAPCLRGYEPSSQVANGHYPIPVMTEDVIALMDHLGAEKAHLIGHDWGAAITYMAGTAFPDRFLSLTAMAVPHPGRFGEEIRRNRRQMRRSWYMSFFQLRGLSDFVVSFNNYAFIRKLWRDWSPGWAFAQEDIGPVIETLKRPGVKKAAWVITDRPVQPAVQAICPIRASRCRCQHWRLREAKTGALAQIFSNSPRARRIFRPVWTFGKYPGSGTFCIRKRPKPSMTC